MSDVYVVMGFDKDEGLTGIKGIYTDPAVAQRRAEQVRTEDAPFGGAVVETWELDNSHGHRTKTAYVAINDAPYRYREEWTVRNVRREKAELSEPDESVVWRKIGAQGDEHDQVIVTATTADRATALMHEAMDGYTVAGESSS